MLQSLRQGPINMCAASRVSDLGIQWSGREELGSAQDQAVGYSLQKCLPMSQTETSEPSRQHCCTASGELGLGSCELLVDRSGGLAVYACRLRADARDMMS